MSRKARHGAALLAGMDASHQTKVDEPVQPSQMGNWTRHSITELRQQVADANAEAAKANETQLAGLIEGTIPLSIPADQIIDVVGTDRIAVAGDDLDDPEFQALVENIRSRGLRTPLRVRNVDPDWRPDPRFPRDVSGQEFSLQSGRRRLAACRHLGIDPICFLSFAAAENGRLDDLHERFFENTARKDLTSFERLMSIGLIAAEMKDTSAAQLSEILGISKTNISRGAGVIEFSRELRAKIDPAAASIHEIDAALAELRDAKREEVGLSETADAVRSRRNRQAGSTTNRTKPKSPLPFRRQKIDIGTIALEQPKPGIIKLSLESRTLSDDKIRKIVEFLERLD